MINGKTKVFGLLGNPIEHTLSPYIHRLLYEETKYNGTYNPFFVPEGQLEAAVKSMRALSIQGLNVTVPYKIEVMEYLDDIDPIARSIGACNTLVLKNNQLVGYNTDWLGLKKSCDFEGIVMAEKNCVILGAGGSARAVAMMCYHSKAASITIINRTQEKADQICSYIEQFASELGAHQCEIMSDSLDNFNHIRPNSIVFQTTSVGMHPNIQDSPLLIKQTDIKDELYKNESKIDTFFSNVDYLVDIIYNPKETFFMRQGKERGVKTINGLGMLFFQAVSAFELWTGNILSKEQTQRAMGKLEIHVYGQEIDRG